MQVVFTEAPFTCILSNRKSKFVAIHCTVRSYIIYVQKLEINPPFMFIAIFRNNICWEKYPENMVAYVIFCLKVDFLTNCKMSIYSMIYKVIDNICFGFF